MLSLLFFSLSIETANGFGNIKVRNPLQQTKDAATTMPDIAGHQYLGISTDTVNRPPSTKITMFRPIKRVGKSCYTCCRACRS